MEDELGPPEPKQIPCPTTDRVMVVDAYNDRGEIATWHYEERPCAACGGRGYYYQ